MFEIDPRMIDFLKANSREGTQRKNIIKSKPREEKISSNNENSSTNPEKKNIIKQQTQRRKTSLNNENSSNPLPKEEKPSPGDSPLLPPSLLGQGDLGSCRCFLFGFSNLLFVYLFLICCYFVFLLICWLFLRVSVLVFFVILFWCSLCFCFGVLCVSVLVF